MTRKELFENLQRVATAIATQFGPMCEVVLHDLQTPEESIVFVAGDVTGRKVGGPITDFVLSLLAHHETSEDVLGYTARTRNGKTLKSSTVFVRNTDGLPVGVFCINFDISSLLSASKHLEDLVTPSTPLEIEKSFPTDVPDLLGSIIEESFRRVLDGTESASKLCKEERQILINDLDCQGVFQIQNSVPTVGSILGVSRYTIYKDLKAVREKPALTDKGVSDRQESTPEDSG